MAGLSCRRRLFLLVRDMAAAAEAMMAASCRSRFQKARVLAAGRVRAHSSGRLPCVLALQRNPDRGLGRLLVEGVVNAGEQVPVAVRRPSRDSPVSGGASASAGATEFGDARYLPTYPRGPAVSESKPNPTSQFSQLMIRTSLSNNKPHCLNVCQPSSESRGRQC